MKICPFLAGIDCKQEKCALWVKVIAADPKGDYGQCAIQRIGMKAGK